MPSMSGATQVKASVARRVAWVRSLKVGRPCVDCGQIDAPERMDWHHREPAEKEFRISVGAYRASRARIAAEIAKCDLVCTRCHALRHQPAHGTRSRYQAGCPCSQCREANATYQHRRRATRAVAA